MARRKNVKRIDPRYFLHETVNRGEEEKLFEFDPGAFRAEEEEEAPEAGEKEDVSNKDDAEKKASISMPSEIKFQDIRKLIDQVRSGKSLKDKETKLEFNKKE